MKTIAEESDEVFNYTTPKLPEEPETFARLVETATKPDQPSI